MDEEGGGRGGDGGGRTGRTGKDATAPRRSADTAVDRSFTAVDKSSTAATRSTASFFDRRGSTTATVDRCRSTAEAVDPRRSFLHRLQNDGDPDMDKEWMRSARSSTQYSDGVRRFIELAVRNSGKNGQILCPCSNCGNRFWLGVDDVHEHLICAGFMSGYITWIFHGECLGTAEPIIQPSTSQKTQNGDSDEIEQLLVDGFGIYDSTCLDAHSDSEEESDDDCDEAAETFRLLSMEGSQELYAGCKRFSKLQFLVRLLNIKNNRRVSNAVFEDMLELFRDALPEGQTLPKIFHELKKFIKAVGLGYDSHHACYNDCIIFRGQYANANSCPVCKSSRWKTVKTGVDGKRISKVPQKVVRHFPLKKRIRRLFMSSKTSPLMSWHSDSRKRDGLMRHPADSPAWKHFDMTHKTFGDEPRNIRFGLAADGFNPYRNMNLSYSIWPIILIPYNVPPWVCMKESNFMLSVIIPGKKSPGKDIDV